MDNLAFHCANIHCCFEMTVLHNRVMLLKPIIQKLILGRRFNRCWQDEVSWKLFRFYFLQYRSGKVVSQINYIYLD